MRYLFFDGIWQRRSFYSRSLHIKVEILASKGRSILDVYADVNNAFLARTDWLQHAPAIVKRNISVLLTEEPREVHNDVQLNSNGRFGEEIEISHEGRRGLEWQLSSWSPCSMPCGGGKQSREATCREASSGRIVDDDVCNAIQAPIRERVCHIHSCDLNLMDFRERVVPREPCGEECSKEFEEHMMLCVAFPTGYLSAGDLCQQRLSGNVLLCL